MRGSAQLVSGRPKPAALRAAWEGDFLSPVHPLGEHDHDRLDHYANGSAWRPMSGVGDLGPPNWRARQHHLWRVLVVEIKAAP
jgi:hypothetical protein